MRRRIARRIKRRRRKEERMKKKQESQGTNSFAKESFRESLEALRQTF